LLQAHFAATSRKHTAYARFVCVKNDEFLIKCPDVHVAQFPFGAATFKPATSKPLAACHPVQGFVRPSLRFRCSKCILHTDNLSLFW